MQQQFKAVEGSASPQVDFIQKQFQLLTSSLALENILDLKEKQSLMTKNAQMLNSLKRSGEALLLQKKQTQEVEEKLNKNPKLGKGTSLQISKSEQQTRIADTYKVIKTCYSHDSMVKLQHLASFFKTIAQLAELVEKQLTTNLKTLEIAYRGLTSFCFSECDEQMRMSQDQLAVIKYMLHLRDTIKESTSKLDSLKQKLVQKDTDLIKRLLPITEPQEPESFLAQFDLTPKESDISQDSSVQDIEEQKEAQSDPIKQEEAKDDLPKVEGDQQREEEEEQLKKFDTFNSELNDDKEEDLKDDILLQQDKQEELIYSPDIFRHATPMLTSKSQILKFKDNMRARILMKGADHIYFGNDQNNVDVMDLNFIKLFEININSERILAFVEANQKYFIFSTHIGRSVFIYDLKAFTFIKKIALKKESATMLQINSQEVLLGDCEGNLYILNLKTFEMNDILKINNRIYCMSLCQEAPREALVAGYTGVQLIFSAYGKGHILEENYFSGEHIHSVVQYQPHKYCLSFWIANERLVGLIDREKQSTKVVKNPLIHVDHIWQIYPLRQVPQLALIQTIKGVLLFDFEKEEVTEICSVNWHYVLPCFLYKFDPNSKSLSIHTLEVNREQREIFLVQLALTWNTVTPTAC